MKHWEFRLETTEHVNLCVKAINFNLALSKFDENCSLTIVEKFVETFLLMSTLNLQCERDSPVE